MELIKKDSRWECISTYEERAIPKAAGFYWDGKVRCWFTEKPEVAAKLIQYAEPSIKAELEAVNAEKNAAIEQSRATDADIEVPAPDGLEYMPFQKAGIAYALNREGTLIGDEMGLGKTIQALGVINGTPDANNVLVICPASLRLNWKKEAETWLVDSKWQVTVVDSKTTATDADNFVIINYDILKKQQELLHAREWDVMIVDECHYLKNPKAQRTKAVLGAAARKNGNDTDQPAIPAKKKLFLTGTPIVNRPVEIQPVLAAINPSEFGNFFQFAKRYCNAHRSRFGWDFTGATNLDELQEKLRAGCMVRRLKADVLTELPAKRRSVIEIPANGKSRVIKAEIKASEKGEQELIELRAAVELAKASDDPGVYNDAVEKLTSAAKAHFQEISRLRRETAIAKAPLVAAHVLDAVEQGGKVVVFAHHHDVVDILMQEFQDNEIGAVKLDGRMTKMEERNESVERFQNDDDVRVFVGSIQAAGVGLTLTAAAHVVFAELDWVPGNISQAEDRCHRIGQSEQVLIQHLVLEQSIDAKLAKTLVEKQAVIDKALDSAPDDAEEPIIPTADETPPISARKQQIAEVAERLTAEEIEVIHRGLKTLKSYCDGARAQDGMGFNKMDTHLGKALAALPKLSPKQAALGQTLTRKYRRQLGDD